MPSSSKVVERMSLGFWKSRDHVHFLRMRGPGGKGHAEIAISQYQQKQEESGEFEFLGISDNGTRTGTGDDGDRARGLTSDAKDVCSTQLYLLETFSFSRQWFQFILLFFDRERVIRKMILAMAIQLAQMLRHQLTYRLLVRRVSWLSILLY